MSETRRERGVRTFAEIYTTDLQVTGDRDPYDELTIDHLFADVWNRPGLSVYERRLLVIGVLAALGRADLVELQFYSALQRGELTPAQVQEIALHLTHYVGWPLGSAANEAGRRAITRHDLG